MLKPELVRRRILFTEAQIHSEDQLPMIRRERLAGKLDGNFVVFLIGMRVNNPLKLHKWMPVAGAMPRMIKELYRHPEMGFLHALSRGLAAPPSC